MAKKKGLVNELKTGEHKVVKGARKADSLIAAAEVLTSGDTEREERWLVRKFGSKIAQGLVNRATGLVGKVNGKKKAPKS